VADVVEFPLGDDAATQVVHLPPVPIEYKRGRPKQHDADRVQLCAQAMCLEEMLGLPTGEASGAITTGHLFYGKTRRRQTVVFDTELRTRTADTARQLHAMLASGSTPPAIYEKHKCDRCSLLGLCMPKQIGPRKSAARRFDALLTASVTEP
jgi:CRISPR-associated exonuclease Cas4